MLVVAERGVAELDFFHGFATVDTAGVSRASKITKPFRTSGKRLTKATSNLLFRFVSREYAYPGLRELIAEFYAAIRRGVMKSPIGVEEIIAVGEARDLLLEKFSRAKGRNLAE